MTTRKSFCNNLIQSKELKEFIEANSNLTPEEVVKMFKTGTKERREKLIANRQADLRLIERLDNAKEDLKKLGKKQTEVATNKVSALLDTSDVGLFRNMITHASGKWYAGAGDALEIKLQSYANKYRSSLSGKLELLNVRIVNNGNLNKGRYDYITPEGNLFDKNIRTEWGILNGSKDKPTNDVKAKETAKALNEVTQGMIKDEQALGLKTGLRKNYAGMQTHNKEKISITSEKDYWDFTLKLLTDEQRIAFEGNKEITKNVYDILAGKDTKSFSTENLPLKSRESIDNFINTRSLEFKNVNAEIEYHRKFGDTADIIDITFASIDRQARAMASFEMFGFQKPDVAIEKMVNYIWDNNLTQSQKENLQNKHNFGLEDIKARLNADLEEVLLGTRLPEWTNNLMKYQGARTLTGTLLNQMGNDITMQKTQQALRTGDIQSALSEGVISLPLAPLRVFRAIYKSWKEGSRAGLTKEQFYEASTHGYLSEGIIRNTHDFIAKNGIFEVKKAGKFDSAINWVHRLAGNTADNQLKQIGIKNVLTKEFRDFANGNFKGDPKIYKDFLRLYFTDNELNVVTKAKEAREGDGIHASDIRYLKSEDIKDLIENDIKRLTTQFNAEKQNVLKVQEGELSKTGETQTKKIKETELQDKINNLYERKKIELEQKFSSMLIAETNRNLNIGGTRIRSIARADGGQITSAGALFMQLKTASISQYFDLYQRTLEHPHFSKMGKLGFITAQIAFLTMSGMMTVMLADTVNNWGEPKKRNIEDLLHEGFIRGGAGGMLYDAVKSLYGRELGGIFFDERIGDRGKVGDIASFIAGPTGGQIADILQATQDLIPQGTEKKIKADKAIEVSIKSIPFSNIFYYRMIANHAIMGIGEVLQDLSGGKVQSKKKENAKKRRQEEEGLFSGQTPRIAF